MLLSDCATISFALLQPRPVVKDEPDVAAAPAVPQSRWTTVDEQEERQKLPQVRVHVCACYFERAMKGGRQFARALVDTLHGGLSCVLLALVAAPCEHRCRASTCSLET